MTNGVVRPPSGDFQRRFLPLIDQSVTPAVSRTNPFCSGPRQWAQSAENAWQALVKNIRRVNCLIKHFFRCIEFASHLHDHRSLTVAALIITVAALIAISALKSFPSGWLSFQNGADGPAQRY